MVFQLVVKRSVHPSVNCCVSVVENVVSHWLRQMTDYTTTTADTEHTGDSQRIKLIQY